MNDEQTRVLVVPASVRMGSVNQALGRRIVEGLDRAGDSVALIDLADYEMPLYDGDLEASQGLPESAHRLLRRFQGAEVVVFVCPEYNGSFTPLLKNTIDWMSRINSSVLAHLTIGLASASPGKGGGANGLAMVRQWMKNMGVDVRPTTLAVGSASLDDGTLNGLDDDELERFVAAIARYEYAS